MLGFLGQVWHYRAEILLAAQFLAALRKTAREATQEYIRRRIKKKLKRQIAVVLTEIILLLSAYLLVRTYPSLGTKLLSSAVLWGITLFNLFELSFSTVPELRAVHRQLKGKIGYAMKYLLRVSVVTELMQLNVVFLAVCLAVGISARTAFTSAFSYTAPWMQLVQLFSLTE